MVSEQFHFARCFKFLKKNCIAVFFIWLRFRPLVYCLSWWKTKLTDRKQTDVRAVFNTVLPLACENLLTCSFQYYLAVNAIIIRTHFDWAASLLLDHFSILERLLRREIIVGRKSAVRSWSWRHTSSLRWWQIDHALSLPLSDCCIADSVISKSQLQAVLRTKVTSTYRNSDKSLRYNYLGRGGNWLNKFLRS